MLTVRPSSSPPQREVPSLDAEHAWKCAALLAQIDAEFDPTAPLGTGKIQWLTEQVSDALRVGCSVRAAPCPDGILISWPDEPPRWLVIPVRRLSPPEQHWCAQVAGLLKRASERAWRFAQECAAASLQRQITSHTLDGILCTDTSGQIILANEHLARSLGYTPEDLLGMTLLDIVDPLGAAWLNAHLQQPGDTPEEKEIQFCKSDGSSTWLLLSVRPLWHANGKRWGTVAIAVDWQGKRDLTSRLLRVQKIESLSILARGVAHHFSNQLTGILGSLSLLHEDLPPDHPLLPLLDEGRTSARNASRLTEQMLAYSGLGHFALVRRNLNEIIAGLRPSLASAAKVTPRFSLGKALPDIDCDEEQCKQLLQFLVTNAEDALEGGDRDGITISTRSVVVDRSFLQKCHLAAPLPEGEYVILEVSDTGHGMDELTLARIFDPFFSTRPDRRGLGLSTVFGIMRGHQGAVRVLSEPGEGTCIQLLFPVAQPPMPDEQLPVLLLLEPTRRAYTSLRRTLQRAGFAPVLAATPQEALRLLQSYPSIRYLLLDIPQPGLDFPALLASLSGVTPRLNILASIAEVPPDLANHDLPQDGPPQDIEILLKPWTGAELLARLRLIERQSRSILPPKLPSGG